MNCSVQKLNQTAGNRFSASSCFHNFIYVLKLNEKKNYKKNCKDGSRKINAPC